MLSYRLEASILSSMDLAKHYTTWVEIDLGAIENNIAYFCELSTAQVMAVVKANAYGHGSVEVARAALRGGAAWLAVARVDEALQLRKAEIEAPILILGYTPPGRINDLIQAGVSLTVWDKRQLEWMRDAAITLDSDVRLHLKVDTGMSRLGVRPVDVLQMVDMIESMPGLTLEGIFTHLARADEAHPETTDHQLSRFDEVVETLAAEGRRPPIVHCANSAAALKRLGAHFDLVRVGIAMYGLNPSSETPVPAVIRPALVWKSVLAQVKTLLAGQGISYGHRYTTTREERIGTIPVGYADGFRRVDGNRVIVGGRIVPVVGRVTMDQIMVNLDGLPEVEAGDEIVILGTQGKTRISAEEIAAQWGTINYEVTSGIAARVPRVYLEHR
jgi:alanine racemase